MKEQIGLVIWGCKGGYRAFCSNNVVNTGDEVIAQTIKDIRYSFRIHRTGHDFYAIEFTPKYKVFTNYRSSNDSGTGAFIAFTIYVPHNLKVDNMRAMFKEMMDGYFREYMNPLSNTPLTGKYDDINKFLPILERYEVKPDRPYYRQPSKQDDKPQLLIYDDISTVDKYFDSPYRPEFYNCQEVLLLSRDIYNNPTNYEVEFVIKPVLIEKISEPEAESKLVNNLVGLRLTSLTINDDDMLSTNGNCPLSDSDTISFSIEKNEYFEKIVAHPQVPGRPLTVKEAVENGWLRRRNRKDYEFIQPTRWIPKKFYLPLFNTGVETDKLCGRVFLSNNSRKIELKIQERGCFFELSGEEVNSVFFLGLIPVVLSSDKPYFLILQQGISPKNISPSGIYTNISEKVINKTSKSPDKFKVSINVEDFNLKLNTSNNKLSLLLPTSKLPLLNLAFEADDYNAEFDGENVSFVPAYKYLYVNKDILDEKIYKSLKLRFEIAGNSYDSMFDSGKGMPCFKLSYNHWLALKNGISQGHIFSVNEELGFTLKDSDKISLQAIVVTCTSNTPVYVTIQKDSHSETLQMGRNNYLIQQKNRIITVDENIARILDVKESDDIDVKKIVLIEKTSISNEDILVNGFTPDKPERYITFINCQNFCIRNNSKVWPIRGEVWQTSTKSDAIKLYNEDQVVCIIKPGINENCNQEKEKSNFKVYWKDDYHCDVTYFKESIWDKIKKFRKWTFSVGGLAIFMALSFVLWSLFSNMFTSDYEYKIVVNADGVIDSIKCQNLNNFFSSERENDNKWNVMLRVSSSELEKMKEMVKSNIQFEVFSESDGYTNISLKDSLKDYKLLDFFNEENDDRIGEAQLYIRLPSQNRYDEFVKDTPNVNIDSCAYYAKKFSGKRKEFCKLAYLTANRSNSKNIMQKYLDNFNFIKEHDRSYKIIEDKKANLEKQENIKKELDSLNKVLDDVNLKKEIAERINIKAKELEDKELIARSYAYISFFQTTKQNGLNEELLKYFSPKQREICNKTYLNKKVNFETIFNSVGMDFEKARNFAINANGKLTLPKSTKK